jgi:hypothetical protein
MMFQKNPPICPHCKKDISIKPKTSSLPKGHLYQQYIDADNADIYNKNALKVLKQFPKKECVRINEIIELGYTKEQIENWCKENKLHKQFYGKTVYYPLVELRKIMLSKSKKTLPLKEK